MPSINLMFSYSDWTRMIKRLFFFLCVAALVQNCGTGVGNPTNSGNPNAADYQDIFSEYEAYDVSNLPNGKACGAFLPNTDTSLIAVGQDCIREAFTLCHPAKYFLDQRFPNGTRTTSFVAVYVNAANATCKLGVHTASDNPDIFEGEYQNVCTSLEPNENIELACRNN